MKSFCTTLVFLFSSFAVADVPPGLKLDMFQTAGSGCPGGSVNYTLAPDNSAVSFLFSQYNIEVKAQGQSSQNCNMTFRLTPPKGYQLTVARIDYRGFKALPAGASAQFWSRIRQSAGHAGRYIGETNQNFNGPVNEDFFVSAATQSGTFSNCEGWPLMFGFETSLTLKNPSGQVAQVSLDSADIDLSSAATMELAWKRCQ